VLDGPGRPGRVEYPLGISVRRQRQQRRAGRVHPLHSGDPGIQPPGPFSGRGAGHPDDQPRPVAALQVGHGALGDDPAAVDDRHRLADVLHQVELMTGEQHRDPGPGSFGQDLGHVVDTARIQPGEGLVQHEQFRVVHQRGGQLHPLLVAV